MSVTPTHGRPEKPRVGLFVTCLVDLMRPSVGFAAVKLLEDAGTQPRWPVTVAGRGSRLIGGSIQAELTVDDVRRLVLDGFFPRIGRDDEPTRGARLGVQEYGLPFVADPAITRHLAAFLRRHRAEAIGQGGHAPADRPARPDAILFNGGALTPGVLRDRIVDVVTSWFADDPDGASRPVVAINHLRSTAVWSERDVRAAVARLAGIIPDVFVPVDFKALDTAALRGKVPAQVSSGSPFVAAVTTLAERVSLAGV